MTNEEYQYKLEEHQERIKRYQYAIGEEVNWVKTNILGHNPTYIKGVIIDLDKSNHKALTKYINEDNDEQIEKVSFLDLIKSQ